MNKVLIIDDEIDILNILSYNLKKEGFDVATAENGLDGIEKAKEFKPDVIILDVMMPQMDGIEVCETIRSIPTLQHILICFLTARAEDYSQIAGLNAGADDYIAKPIKPKIISSRIQALLRRKNQFNSSSESDQEQFVIDRERYLVLKGGKEIQLPRKEFELLALLASNPKNVFERNLILEKVWGEEVVVGDRTIDVHIRKLREKIGDQYIKTVKGVGYKFES